MRSACQIMLSRRALLAGMALGAVQPPRLGHARSSEVVVLTSFPASLYEPFRRAFEEAEPDFRLRVLNRKTTAAIAMVEEARLAPIDVFWASAPDAFEVLKAKDLLLPLDVSAVPPGMTVQGYPIDDPDGLFRGFSISGYGLSWNADRLDQAGVAPPKSVAELTASAYRGLIAMSAPSRSGTTHLMVETILQRYGWAKGWRIWLEIAGNLANVAARSFSVVSGVAQARYGIGLSIDFLGRGTQSPQRLGFLYPEENVFLPASIALVGGGRNPEGARRFARFVLSAAGQRLLLAPSIQRQPVMEKIMGEMASVPPLPFADWQKPGHAFDARLSGQRYELVNLLFDELVTERLVRIQRFWRSATALVPQTPSGSPAAEELALVMRRIAEPPDAVIGLGRANDVPQLRRVPRGSPMPPDQAQVIESVRSGADAAMRDAEARLDQLLHRLPTGAGISPAQRRLP